VKEEGKEGIKGKELSKNMKAGEVTLLKGGGLFGRAGFSY